MSTSELKENIFKAVEKTSDEHLLELVYELLITSQSEVVGYEGKKAITRLELLKRAIEAENDYQHAKVFTVEEAKERFDISSKDDGD